MYHQITIHQIKKNWRFSLKIDLYLTLKVEFDLFIDNDR